MCGRYTLTFEEKQELDDFLNSIDKGIAPPPLRRPGKQTEIYFANYNAAPSTIMPVCYVNEDEERVVESMVWWYMMWKPKDGKIPYKYSTFNARKDHLYEKKTWVDGFAKKQRRCIVPMDGFIEFTGPSGDKTCHYFTPKSSKHWGMAGIYSPVSHIDGIGSFSIITVDPNKLVEKTHDRMGAILHESEFDDWLNQKNGPDYVYDMLQPYPDDDMEHTIIQPEASNTRNNYPELLKPSTLL